MVNYKQCEVCGEGRAKLVLDWVHFDYLGHKTRIPSYSYNCNVCGVDYANPECMKVNKSFVVEYKAQVLNWKGKPKESG